MVKKRTKNKMILITVHLTKEQLEMLDKLVEMNLFPNRSEAIRSAIRDMIDRYVNDRRMLNRNIDDTDLIIGL